MSENGKIQYLRECYLWSELHHAPCDEVVDEAAGAGHVHSVLGHQAGGRGEHGLYGARHCSENCIQVFTRTDGFHKSILYKIYTSPQQQSVFTAQTYDLVTEFYISSLPRSKYFEHSFQLAPLGTKCFLLYIFRLTIYPVSPLF